MTPYYEHLLLALALLQPGKRPLMWAHRFVDSSASFYRLNARFGASESWRGDGSNDVQDANISF
jgi:hypothetical protein